jgi:putative transposase
VRWSARPCPTGARERTQRTVALDRSALLEVMDALKAAEVDDRIRQAAQTIDHAFIEAEVTAVIGAAPHEPQATERESA